MVNDDFPVLPFEPTSVKKGTFRVIEYGDTKPDLDVQEIIHLLWLEPECDIFYFSEKGGPVDPSLSLSTIMATYL